MSFEFTTRAATTKRRSRFFRFWQLRYRVYALIVMLILLPMLYANDKDIPTNVTVAGFEGYTVVAENLIAQKLNVQPQQTAAPITPNNDPGEVILSEEDAVEVIVEDDRLIYLDRFGQIITEKLRRDAGVNPGFIFPSLLLI
jgi:hypothetical protein